MTRTQNREDNGVVQEIAKHLDAVQDLVKGLNSLEQRLQISQMVRDILDEAGISAGKEIRIESPMSLSVALLTIPEVIEKKLVNLSQASFYRAVQERRFYGVTPKGRTIGAMYPAWQFVEPVPELIEPVLKELSGQPGSEIHAFWVVAMDELNELSAAEMLAGKPFETRTELHPSQKRYLNLPGSARVVKVLEMAKKFTQRMTMIS